MDYTTIYSYPGAWHINSKVYTIFDYKLPVALDPRQILYFVGVLLCMLGLSKLPIIGALHGVIRFIVIPYAVGNFLLKKKLDGKTPIRYFVGWLSYCGRRGQYLERFCFHAARQTRERMRWYCVKGVLREQRGR